MSQRHNLPRHQLATMSARRRTPSPPLEWEFNAKHNVVLHPTGCTVCADWLDHYVEDLSEEDQSLTGAHDARDAASREAEAREALLHLQLENEAAAVQVAGLEQELAFAIENLDGARAANRDLQRQLARNASPDSSHLRKRQRCAPRRASSPITISSAEPSPPPSAPPSAPGPAGPSRIEGAVDSSLPPVSLIFSPSTTPPSFFSFPLPFSDSFNSPTGQHCHRKGQQWQRRGRTVRT
jgi:hypothetical protein